MNIKTNRSPLDRETIVARAIEIADEEGVTALTMRSLARRLGYEVMSLYNHIANKGELISLMVDEVAAEVEISSQGPDPLTDVRRMAISMREALVRHPWAPPLWQRELPRAAQVERMEHLLGLLAASTLSPDLAHHGFHAVNNHVLGYTLQELEMTIAIGTESELAAKTQTFLEGLSPEDHPHAIAHIHQHIAGDTSSSFELVLDLILDGLVRLNDE